MVLVETENNFFNFSNANMLIENENGITAYFSNLATFYVEEKDSLDLNDLDTHFKSFVFGTDKNYINLYNIQFIEEHNSSTANLESVETVLHFYNGHQYRIPMTFKNFSQLFNQR